MMATQNKELTSKDFNVPKKFFFSKCFKSLRKILWYGKLSECIKNVFWPKSNTSRLHVPKIAVKLSKMACPKRIWQRGSLMTAIVAKGKSSSVYITAMSILKLSKSLNTEGYLEPSRTSTMKLFCKNS